MQEMFALSQSIECWYIVVNIGAIEDSIWYILSGPDAFEGFTFLSRSATPFSLIVRVSYLLCGV